MSANKVGLASVFLCAVAVCCQDHHSPGKIIVIEDTKEEYVVVREGRAGYQLITSTQVPHRPALGDLHEVHGDIDFLCREIYGVSKPRIVIETKSKKHFQVVYQWRHQAALAVLCKAAGLTATMEERELYAITLRTSSKGHNLKPAMNQEAINFDVEKIDFGNGGWPLEAVTTTELAMFLEAKLRRPVVDMTQIKGRWSIFLSENPAKSAPERTEVVLVDDLGLHLQWEKVKLKVKVIKDK